MRRTLATTIVPILLAGMLSGAAAGAPAGIPGCAPTLREAAHRFVHAQASVVRRSEIAGMEVAIALDPRIAPGFPSALLSAGGGWCPVDRFNRAATEQLPGAAPARLAAAFASVAGMPYLGEVVVENVSAVGPLVRLVTRGGRHGAVSEWTITVDAAGVRDARFTTRGWDRETARAVEPGISAGDIEGITSLPGHTRTFTRTEDGGIAIDATVDDLLERSFRERDAAVRHAAVVADLGPGDDLKHEFDDGLTIKVSYGLSPYTPDSGIDTGVKYADRLRTILAGVVSHYGDFYRWGVRDPFDNVGRTVLGNDSGLPEQAGYINVDSPLAPVCLACAFLTDAIEVHIAFLFPEIAPLVVPISYPDSEKFMQTVIGHEMVHGLQGGYSDGQAGAFTSAFIEGAARASESLHDIAGSSFHTGAIHYSNNSNGCEGFENGRGGWIQAQASGPFNGHTYDACYFWWSYYATHGGEGLVALLQALPEALATSQSGAAARNIRLLEVAAEDGSAVSDLARWGAAFAAGTAADGYSIAAGRTGTRYDWISLMQPATRAIPLATSQTVSVSAGGARAYIVEEEGQLTALPTPAQTCVFSIVDGSLAPSSAAVGKRLTPGQIVVVVAPAAGSFTGQLSYAPGAVEPSPDPEPATCP